MSADNANVENGAMVPAQGSSVLPHAAMEIPAEWGIETRHGVLVSSISEATQEGRDALMEAMMKTGDDPAGWINREFALADVTMHPIRFTSDETGELVNTVRVLLHLDDGRVIDFRSEGILRSLYLIFRFKGKPPYKPALPLLLKRIPTSENRSMYALETVARQPASKKKPQA